MNRTPVDVELKPPTLAAAQMMFDIASATPAVDTYPEYFYLTMCRDFAATSLVAHEGDTPVAYALAYAKHEDPSVLFIWQLASVQRPRNRGVAKRLIRGLINSRLDTLFYVEATIDLQNNIIYNVLNKIAVEYGVPMNTFPLFEARHFSANHPPEHLIKLGPFRKAA